MTTEPLSGSSSEAPTPGSSVPAVPVRVAEKITRLKGLETRLGHLPPDEVSLKELHSRISDPQFESHATQLEQQTEALFGDICDELTEAGFSPEHIAQAINVQLRYPGGPKYCDAHEVRAALGLEGI